MEQNFGNYFFVALLVLSVVSGFFYGWQLFRVKVKQQPEKANLIARFLAAIVISTLIALTMFLSTKPLQFGHAFGIGLLGGVVGLSFAFWFSMIKTRFWLGYIGTLLPFAIPLVLYAGNPFPSLLGIMLSVVLVWFCIGDTWSPQSLTIISLIVAIGLARLHKPPVEISELLWQALPLSLAVSGLIGVAGLREWQRYWRTEGSKLTSMLLPSIALLLGAAFMGYWSGDWRFVVMTLFACFAAAIAQEVQRTHLRDLTTFLWIGLLVISFTVIPITNGLGLLSGYGVALASIALAWLAFGQNDEHSVLWQGTTILITFSLFRLFAEVYPLRVPRADLYTHYTFVGFLLGATIPVLLMRWMERESKFVCDLKVCFWSAATPLILGAVWGVKAVAGYLAGGIAAVLLVSPFKSPTLFAGFATALPLTSLVEPASDLPRKVRSLILVSAVVAFALSILISAFVQRRRRAEKQSVK